MRIRCRSRTHKEQSGLCTLSLEDVIVVDSTFLDNIIKHCGCKIVCILGVFYHANFPFDATVFDMNISGTGVFHVCLVTQKKDIVHTQTRAHISA